MKISIVTVAYNSGRTIADTLHSVARQTHQSIEHIIIDGASTDDTLSQVKLHGTRVDRLLSEPDRGIYDAMNKGLALASGEFVGFLNADDTLAAPDTVARIANAAADVDVIYGDLIYVHQVENDKRLRYWQSGQFAPSRLRFGWMPPHPTFYVRRSLLAQIGSFDVRLRIAADYDFMLRCLLHSGMRVAYIPDVLVKMRAGGASNRSLSAMWLKSAEDLNVLRRNQVGGIVTLMCKNLRKFPQFLYSP